MVKKTSKTQDIEGQEESGVLTEIEQPEIADASGNDDVDEGEHDTEGQKNEGTAAGTPASSRRRPRKNNTRPGGLIRERGLHYVNRMVNVGWLAGYCHPGEGSAFLLQQNNNIEHALRVTAGEKYARLTKVPGRPVLVQVHARGYRNEHGPQLSLQCIGIDRPSILDLPADEVWAAGFGKGKEAAKTLRQLSKENFSPFDHNGELRDEYSEYVSTQGKEEGDFELNDRTQAYVEAFRMLGDVLEASNGVVDSRLGRGQNYLKLAGFVDAKAWIAPTEHRKGYALFLIRQHEDQDKNIPVRISGRKAKLLFQGVNEGAPVLIEGAARRKVIPDDDGNIVSRHCYLEAKDIKPAEAEKDMLTPLPAWWATIRDRLIQRQAERQAEAKLRAQQEQKKAFDSEAEEASTAELDNLA